jgi:hypothetical protein
MHLVSKKVDSGCISMNKRDRSLLFVTDFLPLFVILLIRYSYPLTNFLKLTEYAIFVLYFLLFLSSLAVSGFFWRYLVSTIKKTNTDQYVINEYVNDPSPVLSYLIPYIFGLISINLNSIQDLTVFVFLLVLIAAIYINSDLVFFNPLMYWFDYKIYRVQARRSIVGQESFSSLCLSQRDNFPLNQKINVYKLDRGVIFVPAKIESQEQPEAFEKDRRREQDDDDS